MPSSRGFAVVLGSIVLAVSTARAQEAPPPSPPAPEAPQAQPPQADDQQAYADDDPSALTAFRDVLDPYGTWVSDPTYGLVWVPNPTATGAGFEPYVSSGHWTYNNGWTWVSDYPWGWVPFHYGRWVQTSSEGWAWVPGRTYSGAWVDWRVGNGYVGWAPAAPDWGWRNGAAVRLNERRTPRYVFSRQANVFAPALSREVERDPGLAARTRPYAAAGRTRSGPEPTSLGIAPNRVVRPPEHDAGLRRAAEYARPATAPRSGAQPPRPARQANAPGRAAPEGEHAPRGEAEEKRGVAAPQPRTNETQQRTNETQQPRTNETQQPRTHETQPRPAEPQQQPRPSETKEPAARTGAPRKAPENAEPPSTAAPREHH